AQELRAEVAVTGEENVFGTHRAPHTNADRFLPQPRSERAELAGTLQSDGTRVERTRTHHRLVERDQLLGVARKRRQVANRLSPLVQIPEISNFELGDEPHPRPPLTARISHLVTQVNLVDASRRGVGKNGRL